MKLAMPGVHLVACAERARHALGDGAKTCLGAEAGNRTASRRGLYAVRPLAPGHILAEADFVALRPSAGVSAAEWHTIIGKRVMSPLDTGQAIDRASIEPGVRPSRSRVRHAV